MVGALLLGLVCGVIARALMPGDVFRDMSGPASWAVSLGLGLAGALVGYVIFTLGLGIGETDIFDWGGLVGAIIGPNPMETVGNCQKSGINQGCGYELNPSGLATSWRK